MSGTRLWRSEIRTKGKTISHTHTKMNLSEHFIQWVKREPTKYTHEEVHLKRYSTDRYTSPLDFQWNVLFFPFISYFEAHKIRGGALQRVGDDLVTRVSARILKFSTTTTVYFDSNDLHLLSKYCSRWNTHTRHRVQLYTHSLTSKLGNSP